jgi:hypothetical protein
LQSSVATIAQVPFQSTLRPAASAPAMRPGGQKQPELIIVELVPREEVDADSDSEDDPDSDSVNGPDEPRYLRLAPATPKSTRSRGVSMISPTSKPLTMLPTIVSLPRVQTQGNMHPVVPPQGQPAGGLRVTASLPQMVGPVLRFLPAPLTPPSPSRATTATGTGSGGTAASPILRRSQFVSSRSQSGNHFSILVCSILECVVDHTITIPYFCLQATQEVRNGVRSSRAGQRSGKAAGPGASDG